MLKRNSFNVIEHHLYQFTVGLIDIAPSIRSFENDLRDVAKFLQTQINIDIWIQEDRRWNKS